MKINKIITMVMTSMFCSPFAFGGEITPLQLLKKYQTNKEAINKYMIKSEELVEIRDTAYGNEATLDKYGYECIRDGERVDLTVERQLGVEFDQDGSIASSRQSDEKRVIWDSQKWSQVSYGPSKNVAFFSNNENQRTKFIPTAYGGCPLDGIFWGDRKPVDVVLAQASDISIGSQMEEVNGFSCYIINAITPNGKYTLWIDPQHGYNIAKANVHKSGNDSYFDGPVAQKLIVPEGMKFGGVMPNQRENVYFSIDKVEFIEIDNAWVPTEAVFQITLGYNDSRTATIKKHHKRKHIDLHPDFEAMKAFIPNIPEGTDVTVDETRSILYIWKDGKLIPKVDKDILRQMEKIIDETISSPEFSIDVNINGNNQANIESGQVSNKKTEDSYDKMIGSASTTENHQKIKSKNVFTSVWGIIVICMLLVGLTGWRVSRYKMRNGAKHANL